MCGIAGIFGSNILSIDFDDKIKKMLNSQAHRGPDNLQYKKLDDKIILGHNRLSIIDLSDNANQPMFSFDKRYSLVFNGEIYNYKELRSELRGGFKFKTKSDTEVLLAAYCKWGNNCLEKLVGMFSFAIYDTKNKNIFIARDRFGVKPFYYSFDKDGVFYFSSEIKALKSVGLGLKENEKMWSLYLSRGMYNFKNLTFWDNIYELGSGECAHINEMTIAKKKVDNIKWYYFPEKIQEITENRCYKERGLNEHLECYKELLTNSIKLRFRSDVELGINISGGLDSSVLLGAVHKIFPNELVKAYSFYCGDESYDEIPWVENIIKETNKPLTKVLLSHEEVPNLSEKINYFADGPYGGIPTIAYSKIFETANRDNNIVLLDGQGIDEAWAGYDYYHNDSNAIIQSSKDSFLVSEALDHNFINLSHEVESFENPFDNVLMNKQYRDLFFTKLPRALRFNDRISMMSSTELREPFLDHRLIEYAFCLPNDMKIYKGKVKWALRRLSTEFLKSDLVFAPKRPLQTPQREWLKGPLREWADAKIKLSLKLYGNSWLKKDVVENSWENYCTKDSDNSFYIWQWISLSLARTNF